MFFQLVSDAVFIAGFGCLFFLFFEADKQGHPRSNAWFNAFILNLVFGGFCFAASNIAWLAGSGNTLSSIVSAAAMAGIAIASPFMTGAISSPSVQGD